MNIKCTLCALLLLCVAACAPTMRGPTISSELTDKEAKLQREMVVKEQISQQVRLEKVASPILIANADMCGDRVASYKGFMAMTKAEISKEYQETYESLYGVQEKPTVVLLAHKSPAIGKLKAGDVIVAVNGQDIGKGSSGNRKLNDVFSKHDGNQNVTLTVERNGKEIDVTYKPKWACNYPAYIQYDDQVNAFADGQAVYFTTGMLRFAETDNELALVFGHELAHNINKHVNAKMGNAAIGAVLGAVLSAATGVNVVQLGSDIGAQAYSQGFEEEADYVGLYLTARAGFNTNEAANFWRRMGTNYPAAIHIASASHPSTARRYVAIEQTSKEIQAKKKAGKKLVPDISQVE